MQLKECKKKKMKMKKYMLLKNQKEELLKK